MNSGKSWSVLQSHTVTHSLLKMMSPATAIVDDWLTPAQIQRLLTDPTAHKMSLEGSSSPPPLHNELRLYDKAKPTSWEFPDAKSDGADNGAVISSTYWHCDRDWGRLDYRVHSMTQSAFVLTQYRHRRKAVDVVNAIASTLPQRIQVKDWLKPAEVKKILDDPVMYPVMQDDTTDDGATIRHNELRVYPVAKDVVIPGSKFVTDVTGGDSVKWVIYIRVYETHRLSYRVYSAGGQTVLVQYRRSPLDVTIKDEWLESADIKKILADPITYPLIKDEIDSTIKHNDVRVYDGGLESEPWHPSDSVEDDTGGCIGDVFWTSNHRDYAQFRLSYRIYWVSSDGPVVAQYRRGPLPPAQPPLLTALKAAHRDVAKMVVSLTSLAVPESTEDPMLQIVKMTSQYPAVGYEQIAAAFKTAEASIKALHEFKTGIEPMLIESEKVAQSLLKANEEVREKYNLKRKREEEVIASETESDEEENEDEAEEPSYPTWTDAEDKKLRESYERNKGDLKSVVTDFGSSRSLAALTSRCYRIGLRAHRDQKQQKTSGFLWTNDEIKTLRESFVRNQGDIAKVAKDLPQRKQSAVENRCYLIGLKKK